MTEPAGVAEARKKAEAAELEALEAERELQAWYDRPSRVPGEPPTVELARLTVAANLLRSLATDAFLTLRARVEMDRDTRSQSEVLEGQEAGEPTLYDLGWREGKRRAVEALATYVAELWREPRSSWDVANELEARFLGGPREPESEPEADG